MGISRYIKQPLSAALGRYTDLELKKIERTLSDIYKVLDWTDVTFQNSWVNYGGGHQAVQYSEDPFGCVHMRGLAKNGTGGVAMFTLPSELRPSVHRLFNQVGANVAGTADWFCRVDIRSTGEVIPYINAAGGNAYVSTEISYFRG